MSTGDGVRVVEHAWIDMSDGCRLAAKLWVPEGAEAAPVPAILEYIPYRKNDFTALRDSRTHGYFARCGYASVRVDLRGSGDSDGILADEYLPLEQSDGLEVISWLARQPWCSGVVGMFGISWGGYAGLQIAAHAPPELRAVVSAGSTVDRYDEDVHYVGGGVQASTMLYWASNMLAYNARPPDPEVVGDAWRAIWLERMESTPPFVETWLSHQRRDDFWKHGSVCEDYSRIKCPVYMVTGWHDSLRDSVMRYLAGSTSPAKGLIGPWGHQYPHEGSPGPAIGFLQECVRFFDRYLKGVDNGLDAEPAMRLYLQDAVRPGFHEGERGGRWIGLDSWPSPKVRPRRWHLDGSGALAGQAGGPFTTTTSSAVVVGIGAPRLGGLACNQNRDDGISITFTSPPLEHDLAIVGFPWASLDVSVDQPYGQVAVRLCDVWPDGASTRITAGVLNLSHRDGHETPQPVEAGERYPVEIEMKSIAYVCPKGHHLRLSVSAGYWPLLWPAPGIFTLSLHGGDGSSVVELPMIDDPAESASYPDHFAAPLSGELPPHSPLPSPVGLPPINIEQRHLATGRIVYVTSGLPLDRNVRLLDSNLEFGQTIRDTFSVVEGDPLSAEARTDVQLWLKRDDWHTRVETSSTMSATGDEFLLSNDLQAYEGNTRVYSKAWRSRIRRDLV